MFPEEPIVKAGPISEAVDWRHPVRNNSAKILIYFPMIQIKSVGTDI